MTRRLTAARRFFSGRGGVSLLLLACIGLGHVPLPVPARVVSKKDRSQAFPCQDRPCGCGSAEQCWKGCCCFTNAQKVAWAKKNNVTLPAYVLLAAGREKASGNCCKTDSQTSACCHEESPSQQPEQDEGQTRTVVGFFALRCQGHTALSLAAIPWVNDSQPGREFVSSDPGRFDSNSSDRLPVGAFHRPPVPPPRLSLA